MRSDGVSEQRAILSFPQPVVAAFLFIGSSRRQCIYGCQLVINDSPVADPWTDESITTRFENFKQRLKPNEVQGGFQIGIHNSTPL